VAQASPMIYPFLSLYTGREIISVFGLHIRVRPVQPRWHKTCACSSSGRSQADNAEQAGLLLSCQQLAGACLWLASKLQLPQKQRLPQSRNCSDLMQLADTVSSVGSMCPKRSFLLWQSSRWHTRRRWLTQLSRLDKLLLSQMGRLGCGVVPDEHAFDGIVL
jgi:hypothetical protein